MNGWNWAKLPGGQPGVALCRSRTRRGALHYFFSGTRPGANSKRKICKWPLLALWAKFNLQITELNVSLQIFLGVRLSQRIWRYCCWTRKMIILTRIPLMFILLEKMWRHIAEYRDMAFPSRQKLHYILIIRFNKKVLGFLNLFPKYSRLSSFFL